MTQLMREANYVDGAWLPVGAAAIEVTNPATGAVLGRVPVADAATVERAIVAAERTRHGWAARTAGERSGVLRALGGLIRARVDDLAALLTAEQGKPLAEARGEILSGAAFFEWYAEEGRRAYGDVIPSHQTDRRLLTIRQPVGVVAAITPWNFPMSMIARKAAPALAAGCALVVKPASQTPFSALAMAVLAQEAGLPAGLLNVVTGRAAEIGAALCAHPLVRKLSFTGSTEVGARLLAQCAPTVKKVSMELGGNAPFLVFDDADLDAAVAGAVAAKFRNAGQTCVCANRLYVQAGVYDDFAARLRVAVADLRVGDGAEAGTQVGPLIDRAAVAKVEEHVRDAVAGGATVILGGAPDARGGLFYQPTLLTGVTQAMLITREETFGPVAPLIRFEDETEGVAMANASEYGLAAYFYARDLGRVWRVAEALESGMVGVNTGIISTEVAPFGGVKQSGLGREGGRQGLDDYLETKYVCMGI